MSSLLLLISLNPAFADIGPPPSCSEGEYRVYQYGHQCVRKGYVLIDLYDYDIPEDIVQNLYAGEVVIPGLDLDDIVVKRGSIEVKKEDEAKIMELLKNFDRTKVKEIPKPKEPEAEKETEEATEVVKNIKKTTGETEVKPVNSEKTEGKTEVTDQKNNKDCSNVSVSQSLILVLFAFIFSGFRRRN